jgi:hypothetical protein
VKGVVDLQERLALTCGQSAIRANRRDHRRLVIVVRLAAAAPALLVEALSRELEATRDRVQ